MAGQGSAIVAGGSVRGSTTASQPASALSHHQPAGLPGHGATMVGSAGAAAATTGSPDRGTTTVSGQPASPGHGTTTAGQDTAGAGSGSVRGSTTAGQSGAAKSTSLGNSRTAVPVAARPKPSERLIRAKLSGQPVQAMGLPWPDKAVLEHAMTRSMNLPRSATSQPVQVILT